MTKKTINKFFVHGILITFLCGMITACAKHGIEGPLLDPPAPDVVTDTDGSGPNFAIVRGNYFLLQSECPHVNTALRVAQEQDGVFMEGGFNFDDPNAVLLGFVNEDARVRFFGDATSRDANCTAFVKDSLMHGVCTYWNDVETTSCRFVYGKQIQGLYQPIWNDCESDGSPLDLQQNENEVTLLNGFSFIFPKGQDIHTGVIEEGKILFNIAVLSGNGFNATSDEFNCEANVSEDQLTGRCRDLTVEPATQCTFGYEDASRTANIDLGDDVLFPSPAITPSPAPGILTDITGSYFVLSNDCEDDEGDIDLTQIGTSLGFLGGFDYQEQDPDVYAGTIHSNSAFAFSVLSPVNQAYCNADISFDVMGVSGFSGTCNVVDSVGAAVETCAFSYSKL